jgi:ribosomal protein S18 acetylase RimI-like enzyme
MDLVVRPARSADRAGPDLLYLSARPYYDAFTGSEARSRRLLERVWPRPAHTASFELARLAIVDGTVAGLLVAFPAEDGEPLARSFLAHAVPRVPPWRWPGLLAHLRASATVMPSPPPDSLYVDALAVAESHRRRGVASALLTEAERLASNHGLAGVSLDTGLENRAGQALYAAFGFERRAERHISDRRTAAAVGGPGFVSFFKPV